jgi:hypothetical protein
LVVHAVSGSDGLCTPEAEILSKVESFLPSLSVEVLLDRPACKAREIGVDAIVIMSVHDKTTTDWLLDDPFYYPHGGYWPRYRPVRHSCRLVRAGAIEYLE